MGTIVFLILRFIFGFNAVGDAQIISTLIAIDTISVILLLKLKK